MAKVEYGSFLVLSTGNKTPILADDTLDIKRVVLWVASSSTETSAGYYDSSVTFTGGSAYNDENMTKVITHYRNIGGVKTKVFEATVTDLDIGEFTINVTTCTQNTIVHILAYGD